MKGLANNHLQEVLRWSNQRLEAHFEAREASNISLILCEDLLQIDRSQRIIHPELGIHESDIVRIHSALLRIEKGEPVQYVTGKAHFANLEISVNPDVLIPRPETEELCHWLLDTVEGNQSLLDIGTGSGCIPLAVKDARADWKVSGCDVSDAALETANLNAHRLGLDVSFFKLDVLQENLPNPVDIIVSNPPYIKAGELGSMSRRVVDHEPSIALFVESDDPILFYRRIAELAVDSMGPGGHVFLECHEDHVGEVQLHFESHGTFSLVETQQDLQGKPRFLHAVKNNL